MAKKQTYAAAMKQLSSKKATYEKGLEEANRMGSRSSIRDYERRLAKLNSGMDQLFQAQEQAKAPAPTGTMAYGGKTKYADGGLTQATFAEYKMLNSMLPQQRSVADNARLQELQGAVDTAAKMGWQEEFGFNPDGSIAGQALPSAEIAGEGPVAQAPAEVPAEQTYAGPSITPEEAWTARDLTLGDIGLSDRDGNGDPYSTHGMSNASGIGRRFRTAFGMNNEQDELYDLNKGKFVTNSPQGPTAAAESVLMGAPVGPNFQSFGPTDGTQYPPHNPINTPPSVATTAATTAATASPAASTPAARENVVPLATRNAAQPVVSPFVMPEIRNESDDFEIGNFEEPIAGDEVTNTLSPLTRAKYAEAEAAYDAANTPSGKQKVGSFMKNNSQGLGMAAGIGAQMLPYLMNLRGINKLEGPVDMPQMRAQTMNTDLQVGNALAATRNESARNMASIDANVSNPVVAAAMKRANQRVAAGQQANILSNEASQELGLRNQNLNQLTNTINQNAQIGFQNEQRGIDFRNQKLAAKNQVYNNMGTTLAQGIGDFQNRAMDMRKFNILKQLDQYGVIDRNEIDKLTLGK